jgi:hypothetical protein
MCLTGNSGRDGERWLISTHKETPVKFAYAICILLLLLEAPSLQAADLKTEEAAIRAAIASGQAKALLG